MKVAVFVLDSPSLLSLMVSVDVKQNLKYSRDRFLQRQADCKGSDRGQ